MFEAHFLSLSVSVFRLFACLCLGRGHHQMISFQKIYGLYGLKRHTGEKRSDVALTNTQTQTEVRVNSRRILNLMVFL